MGALFRERWGGGEQYKLFSVVLSVDVNGSLGNSNKQFIAFKIGFPLNKSVRLEVIALCYENRNPIFIVGCGRLSWFVDNCILEKEISIFPQSFMLQ